MKRRVSSIIELVGIFGGLVILFERLSDLGGVTVGWSLNLESFWLFFRVECQFGLFPYLNRIFNA